MKKKSNKKFSKQEEAKFLIRQKLNKINSLIVKVDFEIETEKFTFLELNKKFIEMEFELQEISQKLDHFCE